MLFRSKDEFDEPLTDLDAALGRGAATSQTLFQGPLRARLELLFEKPLAQVTLDGGRTLKALCSREDFSPASGATVLGKFADGKPAWISNTHGTGRAFYIGTLPGQAYLQPAIPFSPMGKGGTQTSPWMIEPLDFDTAARDVSAAIQAALPLLPTGMPTAPNYRKVNPADQPILILSLTSDVLSRGQLYDLSSTLLAQRLSQVEGVGQVNISGGALPAVRIELDPDRLLAQGLALEDVRQAVIANHSNRPKEIGRAHV